MNSEHPSLSIIIVSYNTVEMTLACLESVREQTTRLSYEVIVVDNNSSDGSGDRIESECPWVSLIRSDENLGFAGGNNLAAKQAAGHFLLLLNPDTIIIDHAIDVLVEHAHKYSDAGIWGGRTLFGDRSLNPASCWQRQTIWNLSCRAFGIAALLKNSGIGNAEAYGNWSRDTERNVDIVSGCFFLITREHWERLEGFDPAFFMYGEEADLCLRARKLGTQPRITPHATIIHFGGASERVQGEKLVRLFAARILLLRRHWHRSMAWLGILLHLLWATSRMVAFSVLGLFHPGRWRESGKAWRTLVMRRQEWMSSQWSRAIDSSDTTPSEAGERVA